jgi:hypothetical protein
MTVRRTTLLTGITASQLVFFYLYALFKHLHKQGSDLGPKYVLGAFDNMLIACAAGA